MNLIYSETWILSAKNHALLVAPFADSFVQRRKTGLTDAVFDFLFTYYSCSPLKLKQWVPSFEQHLFVNDQLLLDYPWLTSYWYHIEGDKLSLRADRFHAATHALTAFVFNLCDTILHVPSRFGCFGMHEWAMVYKLSSETLRHKKHKLRLSSEELSTFVESQSICCSHYDAYRFFTPEAKPLNILNPQLETRLQYEQGGCIHANMDLYKWSTKLWPWVGSDFIGKAFMLAVEGRVLDMRASPYDLEEEGYSPIRIETEAGRKEYQQKQQAYSDKAAVLRAELRDICQRLLKIRE